MWRPRPPAEVAGPNAAPPTSVAATIATMASVRVVAVREPEVSAEPLTNVVETIFVTTAFAPAMAAAAWARNAMLLTNAAAAIATMASVTEFDQRKNWTAVAGGKRILPKQATLAFLTERNLATLVAGRRPKNAVGNPFSLSNICRRARATIENVPILSRASVLSK